METLTNKLLCICLTLAGITAEQTYGGVRHVSQNFDDKLNNHLEQHISMSHNLEFAYKAYAAYYDRADVDLQGFRKLFKKLEVNSRDNAANLTTFINKRGGRVQFPVIKLKDACRYIDELFKKQNVISRTKANICYFQYQDTDSLKAGTRLQKETSNAERGKKQPTVKEDDYQWRLTSGLQGLEDALALEKSVNADLILLVGHSKTFKDPYTKLIIESLMEPQVDLIKSIADHVTRLNQYQVNEDYPLGEYLLDRDLDV